MTDLPSAYTRDVYVLVPRARRMSPRRSRRISSAARNRGENTVRNRDYCAMSNTHQRRERDDRGSTGSLTAASAIGKRSLMEVGLFEQATRGAPSQLPHKGEMEALFDSDFSSVRSYPGQSTELGGLGALGATAGDCIAFATSDPDPVLVAHELTHVVQDRHQGGG